MPSLCISVPLEQVMNGHELVPIDEFRRSEWFHLLGKPFGMVHTIGAIMERQKDRVNALTVYRADNAQNYGRDEQRLLSAFIPHLRRSLNLYGQLRLANAKTQVLQSSIDTLRSAIVLISETGNVVFLNAAANRLFRRCPDLAVRRGRLHAKSHADTVRLSISPDAQPGQTVDDPSVALLPSTGPAGSPVAGYCGARFSRITGPCSQVVWVRWPCW